MKMIQAEFVCDNTTKIVWVDASWKLKTGDQVSFKDDDRKWTVSHVYGVTMDIEELDKKWGLDLPRSQRTER